MIEQKLNKIDQYYPAHGNEPLAEKRLSGLIYFSKQNHPYHHETSADPLDCQKTIESHPHDPLPGENSPGYIHPSNNLQNIPMDHCLEDMIQASAITIEIKKPVCTSKAQALCQYVLASQSSHDYTQDTYGQRRHSFAFSPRYRKKNRGPAQGDVNRRRGLLSKTISNKTNS